MYSKKINELATNLNPQETDLIPIGDAVTGQLKTTTYSSISGITGDGVISGGIVTWTGTGLNFNISACTYILNGIRYTSPLTTKTLAAADPTNPRIDVFAVNTSGQVEVIQGTPNINPVEPEGDTPTTLGLTNVTIAAGATTPSGVTRDLIYDENVESWTKGQSVTGTYNYADTAFAYTGSKSLLVQMSAGYAYFLFSKATAMDISNYKSLSFAIRLNTAWTNNTILSVQFYNSTNLITNTYQLGATNTVGFNRNLANTWQLITIPLNGTLLKFNQNSFTGVRIFTTNAAATYRLDTIQLNSGISNPTGGGTSSANSFGFVNGSTGTASSTTATDTLTVVGTGLATTSASGKTLTIAVPLNLTTTGTSGAATLVGNTLNIPQYEAEGNYITGNGTSGQVSYWNGTTSQAGSNNLFWDNSNSRLGIGTALPSSTLHSVGSITASSGFARGNYMEPTLVASANNDTLVGLEIIPTYTLGAYTGLSYYGMRIRHGTFAGNNGSQIAIMPTDSNGAIIGSQGAGWNSFGIWGLGRWTPSSTPDFRIFASGIVNINTQLFINQVINAGFTLDVNGTSRFQGLITANSSLSWNAAPNDCNLSTGAAGTIAINIFRRSIRIGNGADNDLFFDAGSGSAAIARIYISGAGTQPLCINGGGRETVFGSDTATSSASALVRIESTTKGFLPPRMTAAQRAAIATPAEGLIVFQTDGTIGLYVYANSTWRTLAMV